MFKNYDVLFEQFLVNISLTDAQSRIIESKLDETLAMFLSKYMGDVEIYAQGSYAMGTVVKPLTDQQSRSDAGEYDVDIVLERNSWDTPRSSLESLLKVLVDAYDEDVDSKRRESCERVYHHEDATTGVKFHVDYVPIKPYSQTRHAAKRSENVWFKSDTRQLVEWFIALSAQNIFMSSLILILKRARDFANLTDSLPSIIITAMVCNEYENQGSYADDLVSLVTKISESLPDNLSSYSLRLPVLSDDLALKLNEEDYRQVKLFFKSLSEELPHTLYDADLEKLRHMLSDDFPSDWSNYPDYLESLRNRGWALQLDGSLKIVDIEGVSDAGFRKSRTRLKFFGFGERLVFKVQKNFDRSKYGIRWQVLNSEESGAGNRRGSLFEAKAAGGGKNSNEFINHETEQYSGEHWIKYYVYEKLSKRVVEIGRKFYVEVGAKD